MELITDARRGDMRSTRRRACAALLVAVATCLGVALTGGASSAGGKATLLYDYQFADADGSVVNSAAHGPSVPLTLAGDWTDASGGVHFTGNTDGVSSVAYGRPPAGLTLDAPATESVGIGAQFQYVAPPDTCFGDTPNITQIGRFDNRQAQAKIQLSKCADDPSAVVLECRFAGSLTKSSVLPVLSSLPLVNGDSYVVSCRKSPDTTAGGVTITLTVTQLGSSPKTVIDTYTVADLGDMVSSQYVSAGNKYPLPAPAQNTDQFTGVVTRAVYCVGAPRAVRTCLTHNLPKS